MAAGRLLRHICGWLETRRARAHFPVTLTSPFSLSSLGCKSSVDLFICLFIYWGDANVDHSQTFGGDTAKLSGGYMPRVSAPLLAGMEIST